MKEIIFETINALLKKQFTIHIEDGREVSFRFKKESFSHLLGLHYLTDLPQLANQPGRLALNTLEKDSRIFDSIRKSAHYEKVRDRMNSFTRITDMLLNDTCEVVVDFDKSKVPSAMIKSKFLLYKTDDHITYYILGIAESPKGGFYPETYFVENSRYYVSGQEHFNCAITYEDNRRKGS